MNSLLYRILKKGILLFMIVSMAIFNIPISSVADSADQQGNDPALEQKGSEEGVDGQASDSSPIKDDTEPEPQAESAVDETDPGEEEPESVDGLTTSVADSADQQGNDPALEQKGSEEGVDGQASDSSPIKDDTEPEHQAESTVDETDPGEEDPESVDGLTMLYIGGAIAGVAALAIALGSSSGSSDPSTPPPESTPPPSEPTPTPPSPEPDPPSLPTPPSDPSTNPPVGPNLNGADWAGFLEIKDSRYKGFQYISARIVHSGNAVQINTSSTLHYGRQFNGTISSGGYMLMYDSISGEDWTTHRGDATKNRVDLYDFVNWFEDLDRMKLTR